MKYIVGRFLVAFSIMAFPAQLNAQKVPEIKFTADINKAFDQIVSVVKEVWNNFTDSSYTIPELAKELADLAGQENALALTLENIGNSGGQATYNDNDPKQSPLVLLNSQLGEIDQSFSKLRTTVKKIDPEWAANHVDLTVDIGGFSHDGVIYYTSPSFRMKFLDHPEVALEFAKQLRTESAQVVALARQIRTQTNAAHP